MYGLADDGSVPVVSPWGANTKLGRDGAYPVVGLTFPAAVSTLIDGGRVSLCPCSTPQCRSTCLVSSGRMKFDDNERARLARAHLLARHLPECLGLLRRDTLREMRRLRRLGATTVGLRRNVTSDVAWWLVDPTFGPWLRGVADTLGIAVVAYGYTKRRELLGDPAADLLTYSVSERDRLLDIAAMVDTGQNVAVVLPVGRHDAMPTTWHGLPMIDGDVSDYRPADPTGIVVGLRWKGKARKLSPSWAGFVKPLEAAA